MTTADSLRLTVSSGASFRCSAPCRRAGRSCACVPHVAQSPARSSPVQTACPERAMPVTWQTLACGIAAHRAGPLVRRRAVPQGRAETQGKIEGCGTKVRTKPVCTWGWRGTRRETARCRTSSQSRDGAEEIACLPCCDALTLDGVAA